MSILSSKLEFLKGIGPAKAELLNKELNIHSVEDLLNHFPFRYVDKTKIQKISELTGEEDYVQLKGIITQMQLLGTGRAKRLTAQFTDQTGMIELVWFQGVKWVTEMLKKNTEYILYGRLTEFNRKYNIAHPEIELANEQAAKSTFLAPVYSSSEKLNNRGLDAKSQRRIIRQVIEKLTPADLPEVLPVYIVENLNLMSR